jgi:hypothetical protein
MGITPSASFTRHDLSTLLGSSLVDVHMKNGVQAFRILCTCKLSVVTSEYAESAAFYTNGSLIERSTGFAVHQTGVGGFGFKLSSPAGVFSATYQRCFFF